MENNGAEINTYKANLHLCLTVITKETTFSLTI